LHNEEFNNLYSSSYTHYGEQTTESEMGEAWEREQMHTKFYSEP